MLKMFNYNKKDDAFNDIIDEAVAFAAAQLEGKTIENKDSRLVELNKAMVNYAVSGTRYENLYAEKGLEIMKDPRVQKNNDVLENYNVIIAEVINSVLPMVASKDFSQYFAEIRQIGWGDTARFIIKSNELYKVNEIAEGVNRGVLQPIYNNEVTVNTKVTDVAASIDFYELASGVFDVGDFGIKYAKSFEAYIFLKIVAGMTSATSELGAAYSASGFNTQNWTQLMQRVSAANGGAPVYAIGTLGALNQIYPAAVGLQYGLGEQMAEKGYLDKYLGARLIPVDQIFTPDGAVNTTGAFALPDDVIYFVAADAYKPVKVIFEGNSSIVERDPDYTPDRTYRIRIQEHVGVATIVGSKFGTLTL